MQKRNVLNSPHLEELKRRRRKALLARLGLLLGAFAVLAVAGACFSRLDGLNIKEVKVEGNKVLDESALRETVEDELYGKYAFLFPKTNVLIYPEKKIKEVLAKKFPRLATVELDAKDRHNLFVKVSEREAKYMWCGDNISESADVEVIRSEEKCFFMDKEGYIFDEAPYFSGEVYFKFYGEPNGGSSEEKVSPLGSFFLPENFAKLESFKDTLIGMGLKPVIMNVRGGKDVDIYLARSGQKMGPKIMIRSDADPKNTAENLQAALTTDPLMSGFKNRYSSLEYIDIRFGNKVYFKFND